MKKLITPLVFVFIAAVIGFTLYKNKQEMEVKAEEAMKTSTSIPVRTQKIAKTSNALSFTINGTFIPSRELLLKSEGSGKVTQIFKEKGDQVSKGEVIAKLDDELIQAELAIAETKFNQYTRDLSRYENLAGTEAITEKQLEEIQNAHKMGASEIKMINRRLANTVITAPISGFINEDFIEIGTLMSPGMNVVEIVNVMPLKLVVNVSEMEIANIQVGDSVKVKVGVIPDQEFTGKVSFTSSKGDASLKYKVEIDLEEASEKIKPGMFAYATFEYPAQEAIMIERTSLIRGIKNPEVFVLKDGKANLKEIKIAQVGNNKLMLLDGLEIGDKLITSGLINLKDGMAVTEIQ
ncbi:efflux RND transporter periplasmic adaptor subunit [Cyclobacterium marinum]|uniref:efflux RND transporter periplasmic adaptor subunit n=1 Tax=Cyclobacterium marinum TaxID=104 RepID=UPI0011F02625|nr:efflux RND transporter periplasmic adaptor subunit [Cyclobacterium marinum]MBI0397658.1 efflux RND transporter periplasmic adaptor subunit [Cyclobacterium marinum]|tara:strand:- start:573 stop:1622 length:1050 start_codon:yes stop_codon:yes gene_type:complete